MPDIVIRPALIEDAATVLALERSLARFLKHEANFKATLADVERDAFGPSPRFEAWLAVVDGQPAGLLTFFPTYSTFKAKPCLFVDSLYVEEGTRGLGLGRRLMATACRLAVERGCVRVDLNVLDWNPARAFYGSLGIQETGEVALSVTGETMRRLAEG
ncbi:GNAT family N-acetyltransferase [Oceanibaculum pacificum]|uniref:N-acetyltransferase domain-containing protein n=1 Tax=Oceanibaculum pacificum TaxID=580166 RepID=A0A154VX78_9PROT|nr:GNAT family N-acetyltransferase [Oceanibaculum pacificum]KZD05867.1 hypothetical protein AUP43_02860 [Oceanibaculum pacificum]